MLYSLSFGVYLVGGILLCLNFQQVYSVGDRLGYYTPLITCIYVEPLIYVWFLNCWVCPKNVTMVNVLAITGVSYWQG